MRDLPEGRLTILFSDIEGSTELVKRHGPDFPELLDRHNRLLRAAFRARGGVEVRTVGDAFFYVFPRADSALAAAVDGQRSLEAQDWPGGEPLRVRMGLHTGELTRFDTDYAGFEVHRAARIADTANGGQVVVSQVTVAELDGRLPPGIELVDCGEHWLKDLSAPEPLVRARAAGMPEVDRPLRSLRQPEPHLELESDADREAPPRDLATLETALRAGLAGQKESARLSAPELEMLLRIEPDRLERFWLRRIAEWSQPRYRIDTRFVQLTLLLDRGSEVEGERWMADAERYESLPDLLERTGERALVVLGPPGSGKSTLLRHLELQLCGAAFRDGGPAAPVTFYVPLSGYRAEGAGQPASAPLEWLAARWRQLYPDLPNFEALSGDGRMVLLLDGLNEMPHAGESEYREKVLAWRAALRDWLTAQRGNRAIFSCRSLDYSAPLSTPELPVPQLRVEPFDDARVQQYLALHLPEQAPAIWRRLAGSPTLEMLRTPYFLALLVGQVADTGELPRGRASLFTGFLRQTLRRELEQGHPLVGDGELLTPRESRRLLQSKRWRRPWELPRRGALLPALERLAFGMQAAEPNSGGHLVRIDYEDALDLIEHPRAEDILRAGTAISVLDEDIERDEVLFYHQLLQEHFAARRLADEPDPSLVAKPWRVDDLRPPLAEVLADLAPAEPLPVLPSTGWEETARMAAVLAEDPEPFLRGLMEADLALTGEAAAEQELVERLPVALVDALRGALVERGEDPAAELRCRIAAARALGRLGDPRWVELEAGAALEPPWIEIPAGASRLGSPESDALARPDERPEHSLELPAFEIARFPVTNAEWARFMADGGYEEEAWWPEGPARAWRRGEGVTEGKKHDWRHWRVRFAADPESLDQLEEKGSLTPEQAGEWRRYMALDDAAFERVLESLFPGNREVAPLRWSDPRFNHPAQPVIGICWYEARAYCLWLGARSGRPVRLPSEAEWAAAARGQAGRRFAWADALDPLRGNFSATHLQGPSPVGVFPEGRTPEGVDDLSGNCFEWTLSLYGRQDGRPEFAYPYRPDDGREDLDAPPEQLRVARGGSWADGEATGRAAYRYPVHPALRHTTVGFRLVRDVEAGR